jgi:neutral amino acid transport system permease protein
MAQPGLLDALLQGLVTGSIIAAGALGLSLIYSIAEVPNFAHGDMITIGAYIALAVNAPGKIPFLPDAPGVGLAAAGAAALVLAGAFGGVYETVIFRRFRERDADLITMVIVSLGLAFILRNVVLFLVGSKNVTYDTQSVTNTNFDLLVRAGGVAVTTTKRQAGDLVVTGEWGYGWPVLVAVVAVAAAAAAGVYRWRRTDASFRTVYLVSPRVSAAATFLVVVGLGGALLRGAPVAGGDLYATRVGLNVKSVVILGLVLLTMFLVNVLLKATRAGKAMRATADNMALAEVRGVDIDRIQLVVWGIAGVLTALAGVLTGWFASSLNPNMGFTLLLPIFAAVILGGISSPYGAVLGALVVGVSMDVGVFLLPAEYATYRTAIAFVILIAVLLVEPEGLWGDV